MKKFSYIDLIAILNIEDAHPGGFDLTKKIIKFLPITSESSVLEVGCGSGKTACYLYENYNCSITSIDLNSRMLANARKRFNKMRIPIALHQANAENLPFKDDSFDFIISESVTSFTNVDKSLPEYVRVLKKGGYFLAIEMTSERQLTTNEESEINEVYGIQKVKTVREWEKSLIKAGFRDYKILKGNTVMNTSTNSTDSLPFQKLPPEGVELLHRFQELLLRFKDVLGYRVFLCRKR
ncbi:class I SAM-dependent methyltransferase [Gottfriedia sp. NPDC056225]|uniref:class I SAM-dependent methyltransferase n=1 Tax=Gottfriedia sp. NPDC056225 TaxID=3345751 RepID=UPI0035DAB738